MAGTRSSTVIALTRHDGTVRFHYAKTVRERLRDWTLALLWFLVLAVTVTATLWSAI